MQLYARFSSKNRILENTNGNLFRVFTMIIEKDGMRRLFRLMFQVGTNESYLLSSSFKILSERVRIWKEYFALLFLRMAL